ncbi:MAG: hydrogenase maturation protease [Candidatus Binatia bacterium]
MQHIICLGNLWLGDDGFGIHVFRRLNEGCLLPGDVRVIDGGVAGLQALPCFEGCRKAIVVDALTSAGKVGSVHRLELEDLCDPEAEFSLHNLGVNHLLKALPIYLGEAAVPNIVVIGAEVDITLRLSDRLTPLVAASVNETVRRIIDECMS